MDTLRGSCISPPGEGNKEQEAEAAAGFPVMVWEWLGRPNDLGRMGNTQQQKVQWSSVRCSIYIICWEAKRWAKLILSYFALISNSWLGNAAWIGCRIQRRYLLDLARPAVFQRKKTWRKTIPKANGSITWCNQLQVVCLTKSGSLACFSWLVDRVVLPAFLRWAWCVVLSS